MDFKPGDDVLQIARNINGLDITNASDVAARVLDVGGNAVIDLGNGDTVTLMNVNAQDVHNNPNAFFVISQRLAGGGPTAAARFHDLPRQPPTRSDADAPDLLAIQLDTALPLASPPPASTASAAISSWRWETAPAKHQGRVAPMIDGAEAPRPYTLLTVPTSWGGERTLAVLRRPAGAGTITFHDETEARGRQRLRHRSG